jgi:hypothetical protein
MTGEVVAAVYDLRHSCLQRIGSHFDLFSAVRQLRPRGAVGALPTLNDRWSPP